MKKTTPTKLDFAIMGLLRETGLSGYQIRQIFETSEMGNYSSSPGSIYPALKRLLKLGLLELTAQKSGNEKAKKRYCLTAAGRDSLQSWLQQDVKKEDVYKQMDELLLRFAFMDQLINKKEQLRFLHQIEQILPQKISELQQFHKDHTDDIPLNGRLAILHGIEVFQAHYQWVQKAQQVIQQSIT